MICIWFLWRMVCLWNDEHPAVRSSGWPWQKLYVGSFSEAVSTRSIFMGVVLSKWCNLEQVLFLFLVVIVSLSFWSVKSLQTKRPQWHLDWFRFANVREVTSGFTVIKWCPTLTKESEFMKTPYLPKAHGDSFPFLYCLSVPMSHKWPRFSSMQLVMTKRKRKSNKCIFSWHKICLMSTFSVILRKHCSHHPKATFAEVQDFVWEK